MNESSGNDGKGGALNGEDREDKGNKEKNEQEMKR